MSLGLIMIGSYTGELQENFVKLSHTLAEYGARKLGTTLCKTRNLGFCTMPGHGIVIALPNYVR